jgi:hypothetical protein
MTRAKTFTRAALAGAALAIGMAGACAAQPAPAAKPQCFRLSDMENHTVGGPSTLYVGVRPKMVYRFEMSGSCLSGASSSDALVLEPIPGTNLICRPLDLDLKIRTAGGMLSPCIIKSITKLTPAEVAALPKKLRP